MKKFYPSIRKFAVPLLLLMSLFPTAAKAQYGQIVNQLPQILSPALSGSGSYKGFVEATGTFGLGTDKANFLGISTSQGFQYTSWFFMGAGIGIDAAMAQGDNSIPQDAYYMPRTATTRAMVPLFTDFRFNIGNGKSASFFIDIKAGAAWIIGGNGLRINDKVLTTNAKFILRPSIGVRIPTNSNNLKQAVNIGLTYQLLTANNSWYYYGNSRYDTTLSSIGASISYEW
ncbi:MAG: hypothetical protein K2M10_00970 [Muribaculaceae bacterium]|nr:hypothetical protein [Muribaculaceae bacterium]